ncbi:hypothetical protein ACKWTF_001213 [Chironomus riparius]
MWNKIFLFITISWLSSCTRASVMQCQWNGEICTKVVSMTSVYTPFDSVTIFGKALNYVNTATDTLTLSLFNINFIPAKIFSVFKNLGTFNMNNCSTTILTTNSFVNCASLTFIQVSFGIVTNIPEAFAQTCTNLQVVRFRYSNVQSVHKNAFRNLGKMVILDLTGNRITCIHAELFLPTPMLHYIYLQNNKISGIDSGFIKHLSRLRLLNLVNNSIKYLPTLTLPTGLDPIAILLFGNPINAVEPDFCSTFSSRSDEEYIDTLTSSDYKDALGRSLAWNFDVIYLKDLLFQNGVPCLGTGIAFNRLSKADCSNFNNVMNTCYANYQTTMIDAYPCQSACF